MNNNYIKITEHSSQVLRLKPIILPVFFLLCLLFFFLPFFLPGLMYVLFSTRGTLQCERIKATQINCELTSSNLLGKTTSTINQLQSAEVEAWDDSDDKSSYVVTLVTRSRRIFLSNVSISDRKKVAQKVNKINVFIQNKKQLSLNIQEDNRWDKYLSGGLAILVGCVLIFLFLRHKSLTLCLFDKNSGYLSLKYSNKLFQSDTREEKLDDIKIAKVNETINSDRGKKCDLNLVLKSGQSISLVSLTTKKHALEVATTINEFLGVSE